MTRSQFEDLRGAAERGDHETVLRLSERELGERPGDDAAHDLRARALVALGRLDEAERHAADAVRLDPDEIRYRELFAEILAARGAHADAATEYRDLARNDPRQVTWTLAEARERLDSQQPDVAVEAARRAVRLDAANADAQVALARGLVRLGDGGGAVTAAEAAVRLRAADLAARELLADARWLAGQPVEAFGGFASLSSELRGSDRARVTQKARSLYRQRSGRAGRVLGAFGPLFRLALRSGWLHLR